MSDDALTLANESWYGYGRWDCDYWFVGMEPGGEDTHSSYEAWIALDARRIGLIDCRAHHLWKRDVLAIEDRKWTRWHEERPGRRTQPTWRRLIQTLFAFQGKDADLDDVYRYQKYCLGSLDGETAVVELGALHAPGLSTKVDRETFRQARIHRLHEKLAEEKPIFALCYGLGFRKQFEGVVGSVFDGSGFTWCGPTLCVLTPGPTSHLSGKPAPWAKAAWWVEKGREMRRRVAASTNARAGRL